jgi:hypothetical protein
MLTGFASPDDDCTLALMDVLAMLLGHLHGHGVLRCGLRSSCVHVEPNGNKALVKLSGYDAACPILTENPSTRSSCGKPHVAIVQSSHLGQINNAARLWSLHRSRPGGVPIQRQVAT